MSDIVERLRHNAGPSGDWGEIADRLQIEAADEIERLRADSERLVWLIESIRGADLYQICYPYLHNPGTVDNVIAAIDAARAAEIGRAKT